MGHLTVRDGSLKVLQELKARHKIYLHINNTNPILNPDTDEAAEVKNAGIKVGRDGMEFDYERISLGRGNVCREIARGRREQLSRQASVSPPDERGPALAGRHPRLVANRFYYQINIPIKDAAILSNCPLRDVRREWIDRIIEHDGTKGEEGGIEAWLRARRRVRRAEGRFARQQECDSCRPFCGGCLRDLRPHPTLAGRGGFVIDGAFCAKLDRHRLLAALERVG